MAKSIDSWFSEWFDSFHYHLLYQHRDEKEAEKFISTLMGFLDLEKRSKVLDLACGKGRHAIQLHELGYDVLGLDLSAESIAHAKQFEEDGLRFTKGDMRSLALNEQFDLTLNLFTSFGYFKKKGENRAVLKGLANHLRKEGKVVLDYLNVKKVEKHLPQKENIQREDIVFRISKGIRDGFIVKDIEFSDRGKDYHFREFVKFLDLPTFKKYFDQVGLQIIETFGDYELNSFDKEQSDRLIMVAKHK